MVVMWTGYFRRLTYGAVRDGPLDVIIEPVEELVDGEDCGGIIKCYSQTIIPINPEPVHVGGDCFLSGWDH